MKDSSHLMARACFKVRIHRPGRNLRYPLLLQQGALGAQDSGGGRRKAKEGAGRRRKGQVGLGTLFSKERVPLCSISSPSLPFVPFLPLPSLLFPVARA